MTEPVSYVEWHSGALDQSVDFFSAVFGWRPQPFAAPDYLVAAHGEAAGVDSGLVASRDGQSRAVPVIRVASLEATVDLAKAHGGQQVVETFTIAGVGRGCYVIDPAGLLIGLHEYDSDAQ